MNDLVHSMVRLIGGAEACIRASRVLLCTVSSQGVEFSLPDQNPALAFRLNRVVVREGEGYRQYYASAALVELDEELTPSGPSGGSITKTRVGVVPVLFAVEGTESITTVQYPINRPLHHADDAPPSEEMAAVFKDLRLLLANLINKGVVLGYPVDDCTASPPCSGTMVRTPRGWQWQYMPRFWQRLDMEMYRRKMPLQTSLVMTDLYALFRQW